jgi:hypothetical protein
VQLAFLAYGFKPCLQSGSGPYGEDNQSVVRYLIAVLGRAESHGLCAIICLMLVTMVHARRGRVISKAASFTNSAAA